MTKEEAINICKRELYCSRHSECSHEECPWHDNCPDNAPFDSEIQEAFDMAIEVLEQTQWIPCEERLPEENGNYLVTAIWNGKREVDMDYFQFLCQWDDYKDTVVAWMPLPEPYEGKTK